MVSESHAEISGKPASNVPEFSVSELAFSLKKTLEENYSHIRVRGELSRVSIPASGHMYSSLKDDMAVIDAVCWKGTLGTLSIRPEEGLEVICTGRISSYPKSSKYQLIIETMELAGEGALLKMLEERKKRLGAEGLFDPARKKPIPFVPGIIGVVTSPTGAVIRDILHRLEDRFPRPVLLWPVMVQGEGASAQIAAAITGFDALTEESTVPRPDVLIVARGGGSLEDLMAFNEEEVVRAVAMCSIPVISAVGHETDTTLCDYAADLRAPTPTGAAEMAVPRRRDLLAQLLEQQQRLVSSVNRLVSEYAHKLQAQARGLGDPTRLLEVKTQALDHLGDKISRVYGSYLALKRAPLIELRARLRDPKTRLEEAGRILRFWEERLLSLRSKIIRDDETRLKSAAQILEALSFKSVLERGYAVVRNAQNGEIVSDSGKLKPGTGIEIEFKREQKVDAIVGKNAAKETTKIRSKKKPSDDGQTSLF